MPPGACAGGIAVVIDVLRASTTIITALAHGADRIMPVRDVHEARDLAARSTALLGGERGGRPIEGFDLGNSPLEYAPARVDGRPIVITTTNGTAALHACTGAAEVLIGAVVNRAAAAARARDLALDRGGVDVHLVCAGTDGEVTEEDLLGAGAILDAAARLPHAEADVLDPAAAAAVGRFRAAIGGGDAAGALARCFRAAIGGRNLIELGMADDLQAAAAIDTLAIVPRLDSGTGWLVADGRTAE